MFNIIKNHIFHLDEIILLLQYKFSNQTHQKWWLQDKRFDEPLKNDISMCYDMLKDVSRSFAQVIIQLPNDISLDFVILYLRTRALDTIEDDVSLFNGDLKKRKKILKSFLKQLKKKSENEKYGRIHFIAKSVIRLFLYSPFSKGNNHSKTCDVGLDFLLYLVLGHHSSENH